MHPTTNKLKWTDVHTHLHMLNIPPEQAVQAATDNGVESMITIGTEPKDWPQVLQYAQHFPHVYGAVGLHPHHAKLYNNTVEEQLRKKPGRKRHYCLWRNWIRLLLRTLRSYPTANSLSPANGLGRRKENASGNPYPLCRKRYKNNPQRI